MANSKQLYHSLNRLAEHTQADDLRTFMDSESKHIFYLNNEIETPPVSMATAPHEITVSASVNTGTSWVPVTYFAFAIDHKRRAARLISAGIENGQPVGMTGLSNGQREIAATDALAFLEQALSNLAFYLDAFGRVPNSYQPYKMADVQA